MTKSITVAAQQTRKFVEKKVETGILIPSDCDSYRAPSFRVTQGKSPPRHRTAMENTCQERV
jgi:hypothetical protein